MRIPKRRDPVASGRRERRNRTGISPRAHAPRSTHLFRTSRSHIKCRRFLRTVSLAKNLPERKRGIFCFACFIIGANPFKQPMAFPERMVEFHRKKFLSTPEAPVFLSPAQLLSSYSSTPRQTTPALHEAFATGNRRFRAFPARLS